MATRSLIDASIDAFWSVAGKEAQDCYARKQAPRKKGDRPPLARPAPAAAARDAATVSRPEFRGITVDISGREGYNMLAVNGVWNFWDVRSGRLCFTRDVEMPPAPIDTDDDASPSSGDAERRDEAIEEFGSSAHRSSVGAERSRRREAEPLMVRLYLHYAAQVDAWIISDSVDMSGTVVADCGPTRGRDLEQPWRVWDGEGWREDRNIVMNLNVGSPPPPGLEGFRLHLLPGVPLPGASPRAQAALPGAATPSVALPRGRGPRSRSHDTRPRMPEPTAPLSARLPGGARPAPPWP